VKNIFEKWWEICTQDHVERLTVPRTMLFARGLLILVIQTVVVFLGFNLLLQISGPMWAIVILMSLQHYRIWKRYYSLVWPILVQAVVLVVTIYIKLKCVQWW